jgi:C4-dicarboxylate transporter DctM subunit
MSGMIMMASLLFLLLAGVPVGFALWTTGLVAVYFLDLGSPLQIAQSLYSGLDSFILLAIPFFILTGNIMVKGQISKPLFSMMQNLTTRIRGGQAVATCLTCAAFGAMTGSSIASAAALSKMTMTELSEQGYPASFVAGLLAAGGTLGILLPPSVVLVVFASLAQISVGQLFIVALVPGLVTATALTFTTYVVVVRNGYGHRGSAHPSLRTIMKCVLHALPAFGVSLIIIGGIFSGLTTPTEAAALAAAYALILAVLVLRQLSFRDIPELLSDSAKSTASILFIVSGAVFIGFLSTLAGVPDALVGFFQYLDLSWWQFLLIVNVSILVIGCFLDGFTILTVIAPILLPSVLAAGINPYHFAVVLTLNIEIAAITPPIGLNLFVLSSLTGHPIGTVARGVIPFAIALFATLLLVSFAPSLSTFTLD